MNKPLSQTALHHRKERFFIEKKDFFIGIIMMMIRV